MSNSRQYSDARHDTIRVFDWILIGEANSDQTFIDDAEIISSRLTLTSDLVVGTSYDVAYGNAGTDNNSASLAAGVYSFKLTLNEANPTQGEGVGTLLIEQCSN